MTARGIAACALGVLSGALGALSCAQIQPPSGGPEDRLPPRVTAVYPESAAVRVPLTDSLALRFSEPVDHRAIEDAFLISPPVEYRERAWKRDTWILRLREPLREGITYAGLLGIAAKDRHGIALKEPWTWAFSTGDSLDDGAVAGKVVGQRFPPRGAAVYAWPWDSPLPDSTREGPPPDPARAGQADPQGGYTLSYLPRGRPLRICAFYDRDGNRSFDPGDDRLACLEEPLTVPDTGRVVTGVDLFLAADDEPGTVAGVLADSSCLRSAAVTALQHARARRDSLRAWLDGRTGQAPDLPGRPRRIPGDQGTPPEQGSAALPDSMLDAGILLTLEDSLLVGREYLRLDSLEAAARAESAFCSQPLVVRLLEGDTTLVRESQEPRFSWSDIPPGIYRLLGFRDLDRNGRPDPGEPAASWAHPLEVLPLRRLENLLLDLTPPGAAADSAASAAEDSVATAPAGRAAPAPVDSVAAAPADSSAVAPADTTGATPPRSVPGAEEGP